MPVSSTPGILRGMPWLLAALGFSVLGFAKLAEDMTDHEALTRYDADLASTLSHHTSSTLTSLFSAITDLGASHVIALLGLGAVLVLLARRRVADAAFIVAAAAGSAVLNALLKTSFERPRPDAADALVTASGFSFPSGHAMAATTLYGALAYLVLRDVRSPRVRGAGGAGALGVIAAVGASRMYLGVHYLSDVLAGFAAGAAWLLVCMLLLGASRRAGPGRVRGDWLVRRAGMTSS